MYQTIASEDKYLNAVYSVLHREECHAHEFILFVTKEVEGTGRFPSHREITKRLGCGNKKVIQLKALFERIGWLYTQTTQSGKNRRTTAILAPVETMPLYKLAIKHDGDHDAMWAEFSKNEVSA